MSLPSSPDGPGPCPSPLSISASDVSQSKFDCGPKNSTHPNRNVFYHRPQTRERLQDEPIFGYWLPPDDLGSNWSGSHFAMSLIDDHKYKILEEHASKLRGGLPCSVVLDEVIAGGQHLVVKLVFRDGIKWVARLRFPMCDTTDPLHSQCIGGFSAGTYQRQALTMESEIATLQYVAKMTSIPVSHVHGYDLDVPGVLGCPYMLMDMVPGESLQSYLIRNGGITHLKTERLLSQMSGYIAQLSRLRFDGIGRLRFGESPSSPILGALSGAPAPFKTAVDYIECRFAQNRNQCSEIVKTADWANAKAEGRLTIVKSIFCRAAEFAASTFAPGPYPLQHIDLTQQNIMVDEDCNVCGIVDWENAVTVPVEGYDLELRRIFQNWWENWEGLDWTGEYVYNAFKHFEDNMENSRSLSKVYILKEGRLGRILSDVIPNTVEGASESVKQLVKLLYEDFEADAEGVVPRNLAEDIMGCEL